ncbi:hypothetical protein BC832DRAFT_364426 [Gaertneriomyces semiglobifer]|nr:hypothetical protein BC832DRAFT_364426 [Gaertneriomyces semiglobifer]
MGQAQNKEPAPTSTENITFSSSPSSPSRPSDTTTTTTSRSPFAEPSGADPSASPISPTLGGKVNSALGRKKTRDRDRFAASDKKAKVSPSKISQSSPLGLFTTLPRHSKRAPLSSDIPLPAEATTNRSIVHWTHIPANTDKSTPLKGLASSYVNTNRLKIDPPSQPVHLVSNRSMDTSSPQPLISTDTQTQPSTCIIHGASPANGSTTTSTTTAPLARTAHTNSNGKRASAGPPRPPSPHPRKFEDEFDGPVTTTLMPPAIKLSAIACPSRTHVPQCHRVETVSTSTQTPSEAAQTQNPRSFAIPELIHRTAQAKAQLQHQHQQKQQQQQQQQQEERQPSQPQSHGVTANKPSARAEPSSAAAAAASSDAAVNGQRMTLSSMPIVLTPNNGVSLGPHNKPIKPLPKKKLRPSTTSATLNTTTSTNPPPPPPPLPPLGWTKPRSSLSENDDRDRCLSDYEEDDVMKKKKRSGSLSAPQRANPFVAVPNPDVPFTFPSENDRILSRKAVRFEFGPTSPPRVATSGGGALTAPPVKSDEPISYNTEEQLARQRAEEEALAIDMEMKMLESRIQYTVDIDLRDMPDLASDVEEVDIPVPPPPVPATHTTPTTTSNKKNKKKKKKSANAEANGMSNGGGVDTSTIAHDQKATLAELTPASIPNPLTVEQLPAFVPSSQLPPPSTPPTTHSQTTKSTSETRENDGSGTNLTSSVPPTGTPPPPPLVKPKPKTRFQLETARAVFHQPPVSVRRKRRAYYFDAKSRGDYVCWYCEYEFGWSKPGFFMTKKEIDLKEKLKREEEEAKKQKEVEKKKRRQALKEGRDPNVSTSSSASASASAAVVPPPPPPSSTSSKSNGNNATSASLGKEDKKGVSVGGQSQNPLIQASKSKAAAAAAAAAAGKKVLVEGNGH